MPSTALPHHAGFWRRTGAALLDALLLMLASLPLALAGIDDNPRIGVLLWAIPNWLYFAGFHASRWQATPGKRAFGIKVTDLHGARIGFVRATGRHFASWLSAVILCIGYLMVAWTARKQALHDKLAGTLVVDAATSPQDVPAASGAMPMDARTAASIAVLAVVLAAVSAGTSWMTERRERAQPVSSAAPMKEERLMYEIRTMPFFGGERQRVAEGTRAYRHSEVVAKKYPGADPPMVSKSVSLAEGFEITAVVIPEARVSGFGLQISRDGGGFSWEWFDRQSGEVFCKRQGSGQVRARFLAENGTEELAEVIFLDDVVLRLDRWWLLPFGHEKTDHVIVKRGSVLWLAD